MENVRTAHFPIPTADDAVLEEVVRRLVQAYEPWRIYLFGSVARGDATEDSDYDLMVVVPDDSPRERLDCPLAYRVLRGLHIAKDVLVWKRSDFEVDLLLRASLPSTIAREGKLLYEC
ncbi:MAG: nucleotidyltransferase domain-containing protein [Bryobacterales bacterium]|nr:nucleotidyltransferase domain-containing protein [Bryobacterales bacterium]